MALKQFVAEAEKKIDEAKGKSEGELLFTFEGVLYPSLLCCKEALQALRTYEIRENDLLMVSYPKSGSNWTRQLITDMVYTVSNKEPPAQAPLIEFGDLEHLERLSNLPSPRVLITHLHCNNLPKAVFENKVKRIELQRNGDFWEYLNIHYDYSNKYETLVVFRNPKDTAVSLFHFMNSNPMLPGISSWDEFFKRFMRGEVALGSYFDHALAWNKHIEEENILIVTYEDMKKDLVAAIMQISGFFGIDLSEDQIQLVADNGSFKSMKEKSQETHGKMGSSVFRKGEIGDWKNYFSAAQSQEMDAKFEECLAGTKLGARLMYDLYCKA